MRLLEVTLVSLSILHSYLRPLLLALKETDIHSEKSRKSPEMTKPFRRAADEQMAACTTPPPPVYNIDIFDKSREISTCPTSTWFLPHTAFIASEQKRVSE
jgi:hypothetical protein